MVAAPARFVAVHERVLAPHELAVLLRRRRRLLARASGTVVDLGGGTGSHFDAYPAAVERVVVVGADPLVRAVVTRRAVRAPVPVELADSAAAAGVGPGEADTVVAQLVLCAAPDPDAVLAYAAGLLAPGGELLALEHAPPRGGASLLRRAARPLWRNVAGGCDLDYDVVDAVRRAGLLPIEITRFSVPTITVPLRTCVALAARHARWTPGGQA